MIGRAWRSSAIRAAGGAVRPWAPDASKKSCSNTARLADSDRSLLRQLQELLALFRAYRPAQVAEALQKALAARAFGADYVANLLHQIASPRETQPPLQLRDPELNQLTTDPLSLLDYDAFILRDRKESVDDPGRETDPTSLDDHGTETGDADPGSGQPKS